MPLDSQAQVIIDAVAQTGFQIDDSMPPQELRDKISLGKGMTEVEEVARTRDMTIPGADGNDLPVRIYWPAGCDPDQDVLPGVVFFHGGGWVICDLDTHDGQARRLCNGSGAIFVSVDYRLAPEHPFPAGLDDCYTATVWVAENGGELGIDTARLAVAGDSAGGNLTAVVAQLARDRQGPQLAYQLMIYPVCDLESDRWPSMEENRDGPYLTRQTMEWFHRLYVGDADPLDPKISPLRAGDLSNLPPGLIITAEYDPLRDEGEAYGQALRDAGGEVEILRMDGMFHGFLGFVDMIDKAREASDHACRSLREALGN